MGKLDFNNIVIVESLNAGESKTGTELHEFISKLPNVQKRRFPVELFKVQGADEFEALMGDLIRAAKGDGMLPIVHLECHGTEHELVFADGTCMTYVRASRLLLQLNRYTNLNLVAVFAACFGGFFLRQLELLRRCPVRMMVGPSEEVMPYELRSGFRVFYQTLFDELSIAECESKLNAMRLSRGRWILETAESWYCRVAYAYLKNECSIVALKRRAAVLHERKTQLVGSSGWSKREICRRLTKGTRQALLDKYFRRFFMVHPIPANAERFRPAAIELCKLMLKLRRKRTHAV